MVGICPNLRTDCGAEASVPTDSLGLTDIQREGREGEERGTLPLRRARTRGAQDSRASTGKEDGHEFLFSYGSRTIIISSRNETYAA